MIRHIVLFKIKAGIGPDKVERLTEALRALKDTTSGYMVECEVAIDEGRKSNSYDVCLNSVFRNMDELEKYAVHPEHVKVLDMVRELCAPTIKVDYPI
jgi:hypothetical protein